MIASTEYAVEVLTALPDPAGTETRTYDCSCGEKLVVEFPEECNWDDTEGGALDDAGWVIRGHRYLCGICRWKD